jgi:hypothetical protein
VALRNEFRNAYKVLVVLGKEIQKNNPTVLTCMYEIRWCEGGEGEIPIRAFIHTA